MAKDRYERFMELYSLFKSSGLSHADATREAKELADRYSSWLGELTNNIKEWLRYTGVRIGIAWEKIWDKIRGWF